MKKSLLLSAMLLTLFLSSPYASAAENPSQDLAGITRDLDLYVDAAVKGDSKVVAPAFAPAATMSYVEKGKLVTVPISELFAYYDKTGPHPASYRIETVKIAGDVAIVAIDSKFGDSAFDDVFTLVKDGNDWKIVSKAYHVK